MALSLPPPHSQREVEAEEYMVVEQQLVAPPLVAEAEDTNRVLEMEATQPNPRIRRKPAHPLLPKQVRVMRRPLKR